MKDILKKRFKKQSLTQQQAYNALSQIGGGYCSPNQITAFITSYILNKTTVDELKGFRQALLDLSLKLDVSDFETIDVCGTGGDGKQSFNISTITAFILAGAGYKVTKHGNYGVSSFCGSSHIMEYLGYKFTNDSNTLRRQLDSSNFCMLHAPLFHPAMKYVAPIRKELGVKTFFNILGPLVNPSSPSHQMIGVYNQEIARTYHYLLQNTNLKYQVVYSLDGYDEISLTGATKVYNNQTEYLLTPQHFSVLPLHPSHLKGGQSVKDSARIFTDILNNKASAQQTSVVLANAAVAIQTIKPQQSILDCYQEAQIALDSGKAFQSLKKILN